MRLNNKIVKMAVPLILSNITVPLLGLSNTIIAGHLTYSYYLAAVGLGAMIFNFLYWGLGFFRMSSTGLIAQAYGAKDQQEINSTVLHSIGLAVVTGLLLILLQYPLYRLVVVLVHPDENILHLLKQYYLIRIWGAPAVLVNYVLVGTIVGIHKPRGLLLLLSITNFLAILLSIILVFGFHLNIKGLAIADMVAQYVGLLIGFVILSKHFNIRNIFRKAHFQFSKLTKLLHANRDIFIRTLCIIG